MKAHGINPNGNSVSGQSTPATTSPAKGTPATKGSKGTPSKKRKAAAAGTPSKKGKFKPETDTETETPPLMVKAEDDHETGQISGGGMYKSATNPDPMLSETAAKAADQDAAALFNEFCHPIDSEAETNTKKARRGTKGTVIKKQEDPEVEEEDADAVIFKEEPEVVG